MLFDSHAHLNFATFNKDADEVIQRSLDNDTWMINVGSQLSTGQRAIELAQQHPKGVYAAVGLHPIHVSEDEIAEDEEYPREKYAIDDLERIIGKIRKLAQENKVVAIGEVGLDYFYFPDGCDIEKIKKWQKKFLIEFINLAVEANKPLILHCRGDKDNPSRAYEDLLEIVGAGDNSTQGVIHCFGANLEVAKRFIDLGFYIGFTGIITFKNAKELQEVAAGINLKNILIETDCPYLAPEPFRGKRNEPIYVRHIAEKFAELKGLSFDEVAKTTFENAKSLFGKSARPENGSFSHK